MADPNGTENSSDEEDPTLVSSTELCDTIVAALEAFIKDITQELFPEQYAENAAKVEAQRKASKMKITKLFQNVIESLDDALGNYKCLMEFEKYFVEQENELLSEASWIIQENFDIFFWINKNAKTDEAFKQTKEICKAQVIKVAYRIKQTRRLISFFREKMQVFQHKVAKLTNWQAFLRKVTDNL